MRIEETMDKYLVEAKYDVGRAVKSLRRSLQMLNKDADKFVKNVKMTKGVIELMDGVSGSSTMGNLNNDSNDMEGSIEAVIRGIGDIIGIIEKNEDKR
jgi:hypothetical protein